MDVLDTVRLKPLELLTDDDKQLLQDNYDNLNDEEKWAFGQFLVDPASVNEEDQNNANDSTSSTDTDNTANTNTDENSEKKTEEEKLTVSKAELDQLIQERIEAQKKQAEAENSEEADTQDKVQLPQFFEKGWKPADANEFAQALYDKLAPILVNDFTKMTERQKQQIVDYNSQMDEQYNDLAKKHSLPAMDTDEGKKIDAQIASIAVAHGKKDYYEAFDLWSKIPVELGGGYGYKQGTTTNTTTTTTTVKPKINLKERAAMVSGGKTVDNAQKNATRSHYDLQTKSLDSLMDEALSQQTKSIYTK